MTAAGVQGPRSVKCPVAQVAGKITLTCVHACPGRTTPPGGLAEETIAPGCDAQMTRLDALAAMAPGDPGVVQIRPGPTRPSLPRQELGYTLSVSPGRATRA